jgi:hypothetical protein
MLSGRSVRISLSKLSLSIPPSEDILEMAQKFGVDLIIMGLHRSSHTGTASHTPWTTAYEVVCGAGCPVLTVRSGVRPS